MESTLQRVIEGTLRHYLLRETPAMEVPIISDNFPEEVRVIAERIHDTLTDRQRTTEDFALRSEQGVTQLELTNMIAEFYAVRGFTIEKPDDQIVVARRDEDTTILINATVLNAKLFRVSVLEMP